MSSFIGVARLTQRTPDVHGSVPKSYPFPWLPLGGSAEPGRRTGTLLLSAYFCSCAVHNGALVSFVERPFFYSVIQLVSSHSMRKSSRKQWHFNAGVFWRVLRTITLESPRGTKRVLLRGFSTRRESMPITPMNSFKGRHYPGEVILLCVRWYLQYPWADEKHVAEANWTRSGVTCLAILPEW